MTPLRFHRRRLFDLRPEDPVFIGDVAYIVRQTARGGMGCVVLIERDTTVELRTFSVHGIRVALKAVLPENADGDGLALFRRELTIWAGFDHPSIVRLSEIVEAKADGWIAAMDWCAGSLRDLLQVEKRLPLADATWIITHLIYGLEYAYRKSGAIHLDLKPENVLFTTDPFTMGTTSEHTTRSFAFMLSDWGIASIKQLHLSRIASHAPSHAEAMLTFNNLGTVHYMAPERFIEGFRASVASDMFSLGMIYLELLTGTTPFDPMRHPVDSLLSSSYLETANTLLGDARIPSGIRSLILSMLAPRIQHRPPSYIQLRQTILEASRKATGLLARLFG